jgi:Zinc-binding dehydrogenase
MAGRSTSFTAASFRPEVLLECSGVPEVVSAGITALQPLDRAVLVGMGSSSSASLPVQAIQNRELTVTGTFRYAHTYPAAISLAAAGRIDLDALVGARVALAESERALTMGRRRGHRPPEVGLGAWAPVEEGGVRLDTQFTAFGPPASLHCQCVQLCGCEPAGSPPSRQPGR